MTSSATHISDLPLVAGTGPKRIVTQNVFMDINDQFRILLEGRPNGFVLYSASMTFIQGALGGAGALVEADIILSTSPTGLGAVLLAHGNALGNYVTATIPEALFSAFVPGTGIQVPGNWNVYLQSDGNDSFIAFVRLVYGT